MSNATVSIVRPEFQLITAGIDFVSTTKVQVRKGQVYGRLYFAPNCQPLGQSIKGRILSDRINRGHRVVEFICSDFSQYRKVYQLCQASNIRANVLRTEQLLASLERSYSAPAAVRPAAPSLDAEIQAARELAEADKVRRSQSKDYWNTPESTEVLFPGVAPVCNDAENPWFEVEVTQSDEIREVLESKTVKQLRHIAKVYGVTLASKNNKAQVIDILTRQFTRRNINPVQIRTLPTAK
jgi:Rho termination factor-like protein